MSFDPSFDARTKNNTPSTTNAGTSSTVDVASAMTAMGSCSTSPPGSSSTSPTSSSPVKHVDPMVRALNTIMYGILVHFATISLFIPKREEIISSIDSIETSGSEQPSSWSSSYDTAKSATSTFATILLAHEYWVYLQHSNVFGNPLCQRLDRQYGIALLKSNQHWAIAGTLAAYWCRETVCMFLCLPYIVKADAGESHSDSSSYTKYLILYSLIYHTIKSNGVRKDAIRRYSTPFGIMRVVIDKFYHHTYSEQLVSLVRLVLQGFDTYIHATIISNLISSPYIVTSSDQYDLIMSSIHILFVLWLFHAACNQWFTCSTASVMVQAWYSLTGHNRKKNKMLSKQRTSTASTTTETTTTTLLDTCDSESDTDATSATTNSDSDTSDVDDDFVVRYLLRPGRVSDKLKGDQGAASKGVDNAVKIEMIIAIIAGVYIIGFDDVPFRIFNSMLDWDSPIIFFTSSVQFFVEDPTAAKETMPEYVSLLNSIDNDRFWMNLLYGWLLYSILFAMSVQFLPSTKSSFKREKGSKDPSGGRKRSIVYALDVLIIATGVSKTGSSLKETILSLFLVAIITSKSFLRAANLRGPKVFWRTIAYYEILAKGMLGRWLIKEQKDDVALIGSLVCIIWTAVTLTNGSSIPDADRNREERFTKSQAADVVFLGHPAELCDCWALWLLPYALDERWRRPWWSVPLWPLHYLIGYYTCNFRQKLFGDSASFFPCDDVFYEGLRMQTWTAVHFGRHFVTSKSSVRRNIEAVARHADNTGVKVLCLGALNKAESINGGGLGVVQALGPHRSVSVIHGNHLTAAAVVETTHQCFGDDASVFLTGASSKVGWAVARALRDRFNYNILCHSTDKSRRDLFKANGFLAASTLYEGTAFSSLWIVGKYDREVAKCIPQGATAIVFSVPHPLESRKDVRVVEAGMLHIDLTRFNRPRRFTNKLEGHEIFACHAASVVAANRLRNSQGKVVERMDEIGPVDPNVMDSWLGEAKELGFRVPTVLPVVGSKHDLREYTDGSPPVMIIGAGPAGLATAAKLRCKGIHAEILEEQTDCNTFGSWSKHFSGLSITTQKKWCNLPGFKMDDHEFPGETVDAAAYTRYLRMYAERFNICIRRGCQVDSVVRGGEASPWIVKCQDGSSYPSSAVVVATGKHRLPLRDTSDKVGQRMQDVDIDVYHSSDLRDEETWNKAIEAAKKGTLCVVGFGNSAADLCTAILQSARDSCDSNNATIHVATRTVPPVFPRSRGFLRVDTIGSYVRWMPNVFQDMTTRLLWWGIPSSAACDAAFPAHLPRWNQLNGRVPVIDKFNQIGSALKNGQMIGHGPIRKVSDTKEICFEDGAGVAGAHVSVEVAIMATGYKKDCVIAREDRLNGIFMVGFGNDKFLPLKSIGEEAEVIADAILESKTNRRR